MKIRSVRPEFFADPTMAELSFEARLLYIGLWCYVDDDGRGEWLPKQIDGLIFPLEDVDIHALLAQLIRTARIVRYSDGDRDYFHIPTFTEYQRPNRKYDSKLPDPAECGSTPRDPGQAVRKQCASSADAHAVEGEGEGEGVVTTPPKAPPLPEERIAREWCDIRSIQPTPSVLRHMIPKIREYIATAGGPPTRAQLEEFHRRGIKTPGGWGFGTAREPGELSEDEWNAIVKGGN